MKKKQLAAAALAACMLMTGACGKEKVAETGTAAAESSAEVENGAAAEFTEESVRDTVERFLIAYRDTDAEEMSKLCTETVLKTAGMDDTKVQTLKRRILASLGYEDSTSGSVNAAAESFAKLMTAEEVRGFDIQDVSMEDGKGYVIAKIMHGPSGEILDSLDLSGDFDEIQKTYMESHREELISLYTEKGEEAVEEKLREDVFPLILEKIGEKLKGMEPVVYTATIEMEVSDGEWKVTNIFENSVLVGETGEETEAEETEDENDEAETETIEGEEAAGTESETEPAGEEI